MYVQPYPSTYIYPPLVSALNTYCIHLFHSYLHLFCFIVSTSFVNISWRCFSKLSKAFLAIPMGICSSPRRSFSIVWKEKDIVRGNPEQGAGCRVKAYLIGKLIQWHTEIPSIDDIGLVLCVVEFGLMMKSSLSVTCA